MTDDGQSPESGVSARANAQDKLASMQRKQRRQGRRGIVVAGVVGVVVLLGIGGGGAYLVASQDDDEATSGKLEYGKVTTYKLDDKDGGKDREHKTSDFNYKQEPPAGGAHHAAWANCGVYDKEIKREHAVHSLEHGTVWITYKSSVSKAQVNQLKAKVQKQGDYMLMSKDDKQSPKIVLTAWGKQLAVKKASDPAVDKFIKTYWKGKQTPEPGASCQGAYDPNTGQTAGGM